MDLIDGAVYEKAEEEFSVRLTTTESFVEITLSEATAHIIDNDGKVHNNHSSDHLIIVKCFLLEQKLQFSSTLHH